MADIDRTAGALDLAASVAKLACSIWMGPPAMVIAGTITDLLRPRVANSLERHRLKQIFSECTGLVATRLLAVMDNEFRSVLQNEREAAILAARDTLERACLDKNSLIQADTCPWARPSLA